METERTAAVDLIFYTRRDDLFAATRCKYVPVRSTAASLLLTVALNKSSCLAIENVHVIGHTSGYITRKDETMCGRYTLGREPESLLDYFHIHGDVPVYHLSYNIAPTQMAPVVIQSGDERVCRLMRWGLIPNWSKGPDARFTMINAKAETIDEKPAYKRPFKRQRCLVPCDGFYEWKPVGRVKQPYYIHKPDQGLLALAGIWERWEGGDAPIESFSIITTGANTLMQTVHERMPVIIAPDDFDEWLAAANDDTEKLKTFLQPYAQDDLVMHPVSHEVNSPKHDSVSLTQPIAP